MLEGIGPNELIVIGIILILLFGGGKLKEIARGAGESTRELNKVKNDLTGVTEEFKSDIISASEGTKPAKKTKKTKATVASETTKKGGKTSV